MQRPRIKLAHRPVRYGASRVLLGGAVYGIAAEVIDPAGRLWALLELLDGSRTVDQVIVDLVHREPDLTDDEITQALRTLENAGYLEDAAAAVPSELTARDRERYSRGRALFEWMDLTPRATAWDAQRRLKRARVIVIGVGGVGCAAALALAMTGAGHLHCVEPDVVELSNLNRQLLYTDGDVDRPKIDIAVARLRAHNSDIVVTGERTEVTGPDTMRHMVSGFDVVVLTADQPSDIRNWANQACHSLGIPWVHGGYHGPLVSIGIFRPGAGPCYECALLANDARSAANPPQIMRSPTADVEPVHAVNAISAAMAGNLAAHAAISLLTGVPRLHENRHYALNLATLNQTFTAGPVDPHPRCPTCAA
jgi:bacteriocin biosynthesis cyclodehydratase domain-containing protein